MTNLGHFSYILIWTTNHENMFDNSSSESCVAFPLRLRAQSFTLSLMAPSPPTLHQNTHTHHYETHKQYYLKFPVEIHLIFDDVSKIGKIASPIKGYV